MVSFDVSILGVAGVVEVPGGEGSKIQANPRRRICTEVKAPAAVDLGVGTGAAAGVGVSPLRRETKN